MSALRGAPSWFFASPTRRPSLVILGRLPRQRQTLADQLVLGLVTGALFGPGFRIEGRESTCIRFHKLGGPLRAAPDRGEILLTTDDSGETQVECRIWCVGLILRRILGALLLGAVLTGLVAALLWIARLSLVSRWPWAVAGGLLVALVTFAASRRSDAARMREQMEAFLHNTTYLQSV
jgi:hypothetical protein